MAFLNDSFELGTVIVGDALNWVQTSSTAVQICGFGDNDDPIDIFLWDEIVSDITSGFRCFFNIATEDHEDFQWGGAFIDEWYSGWTSSISDDFVWSIFDDVFVAGITTGPENFDWSVFNDIFVPGAICIFDSSGIPEPYEDFEEGW